MVILTLNCGSSSAKYQVYDWANKDILAVGVVERIGLEYSTIEHKANGKEEYHAEFSSPTHKEAIELIIRMLMDDEYGVIKDLKEIGAVGHRVLHGGEVFKKSALVTDEVIEQLKKVVPLGPLHMPANIMGIEAARKAMPDVPQAIVLDTAWHQTMPDEAFMYAVPYEWYTKYNVRRYGFHGTSHLYCAKRAAVVLGKENKDTNVIICHIGNGASVCAVKNGICIDTSMGLTPLEGLVMGSRSGDIDPAIIPYMMDNTGMSAKEMDTTLNKKSGLIGLCGKSDRRDVLKASQEGDLRAKLAIDMECRRLKKYIGGYATLLDGKLDAIVFTAGVGEMARHIRLGACKGLEAIGAKLDEHKNEVCFSRNGEFVISTDDSPVKILVIPTDEELVMTEDAYALMNGTYDVHTNFHYTFEEKDYVNKGRERDLKKNIEKNPELATILAIPR
ncbi:MAG: acetate kinase [Sphaerochaeta sp.]|jgi:acetate kinase|uniref:acetate kinase n=1 Tax=unclassified Sphaerochaeta TaxID=2637943 RepID=UPI000A515842|nr:MULTISPECIES: acetate kinase [unclassified Sphaerochaeta]MCK9599534.1 acetate kinase [Sphaerochaeta sp.]MDX9823389.1 acetate kinase [Sphaerochaeta sp.]HPE93717.1 acetate kinase [Sphaerochaeta sp.]